MGERPSIKRGQRYLVYESLCRYNFAKGYCCQRNILDIGCGEGFGTALLADSALKVFGIDYAGEAIAYAMSNLAKPNLVFLKMDCARLGFHDSRFDIITAFEIIEHLSNPERFLSETSRVLKDNGLVIISSMQKHGGIKSNNPFHLKDYSREELMNALSGYYKYVELYGTHCIRRINPFQQFVMDRDHFGISRSIRQRLRSGLISKIEKLVGTTPPEEVWERDFVVTRSLTKAINIIAICSGKRLKI